MLITLSTWHSKVALETSGPVMIDAVTYRQGHHSTSDDLSS